MKLQRILMSKNSCIQLMDNRIEIISHRKNMKYKNTSNAGFADMSRYVTNVY